MSLLCEANRENFLQPSCGKTPGCRESSLRLNCGETPEESECQDKVCFDAVEETEIDDCDKLVGIVKKTRKFWNLVKKLSAFTDQLIISQSGICWRCTRMKEESLRLS